MTTPAASRLFSAADAEQDDEDDADPSAADEGDALDASDAADTTAADEDESAGVGVPEGGGEIMVAPGREGGAGQEAREGTKGRRIFLSGVAIEGIPSF